ncbi:MAG: YbaN family protein [Pirellulaceae bacterium]
MESTTEKAIERCPVMSTIRGKSPEPEFGVGPAAAITTPVDQPGWLKRYFLMVTGLFFVAFGAVGVILPGIPTAGPLILASICLTKSCPWLEQKLVRSRYFAAFHQYLDGNVEMPMKARLTAIGIMWVSIITSCALLFSSGQIANWLIGLIVLAGVVGTVVISRYGRKKVLSSA